MFTYLAVFVAEVLTDVAVFVAGALLTAVAVFATGASFTVVAVFLAGAVLTAVAVFVGGALLTALAVCKQLSVAETVTVALAVDLGCGINTQV